jgi:prevent-host-death family protein
MDVAVSELRAHLSDYLERARGGDEVVITDRGVPIARLTGVSAAPLLEQLMQDGTIGRPGAAVRPKASGRKRPKTARPLSDAVTDQRR